MTLHARKEETSALASEARRAWTASMIHPLADQGRGHAGELRGARLRAGRGPGRRDPRHLGARPLSLLHQRRARRRGPADPGLDLLRQADRLSRRIPSPGLLRPGANRIEIWLADGWYRSQIMWASEAIFNCWGDKIGALAEIVAGDAVLLRTDASWKSGALPILRSGIYFGEVYDARARRSPGDRTASRCCPSTPAFLSLRNAGRSGSLRRSRCGRAGPTARAGRSTTSARTPRGYVAIEVRGAPGARVIVEHSEIVDRDREIDNRNYPLGRRARSSTR